MESKYIIQLIGVLLIIISAFILGIYAIFNGHRGTRPNQRRTMFVPINLFTTILMLVLLAGGGILIASQFQGCAFLNHWVPALYKSVGPFMRCR